MEKRKITDHFPKMDTAKKPKEAVEYPLKGFLLYFEENSQTVSQEENIFDKDKLREKCLEIWKNFTSDEKKDYKTPRVPKCKRKNDVFSQFTEKSTLWKMIFRYKHKEAFSTLVESLVQMTCSDFTNLLKLTEFTI